ncbi:unnamed protein product [Mytilus coruscus]|uniref:Uncharacterized protein n=1 Tax=Mytilus coruscus TaxID=42192 RepID=A0A6J8CC52_MYTCO|nr:unnamed protein product [Mytilus coruscus]
MDTHKEENFPAMEKGLLPNMKTKEKSVKAHSYKLIQGQGGNKVKARHTDTTENDRTLEILERMENSVVDAINKTHEKIQDDIIIQLKFDLQNEKSQGTYDGNLQDKKFEEIKNTISTTSSEIKSETHSIMKEGYDKNKIDPIAETLQKINENSITATKALEVAGTKLSDNTRTNREIKKKTLEDIAKTLNSDKQYSSANSANNPVKRKSTHSKESIPNIEVTNRYSPLADVDESEQTGNFQFQNESPHILETKKLILGNSHVRYIRPDNFLQGCTVRKYTSYSISEMEDKFHELDTDYDCIFFHVYTNDIRAETPDVFIQKLEFSVKT